MKDPANNIWPERLMIRDTQLNDDMGGLGQRIYTTAGQGYEKREYIRADTVPEPIRAQSQRPQFNKLRPEELATLKLRMRDLLRFLGAPGEWGYDSPMADLTIHLLTFSRQYLNIG